MSNLIHAYDIGDRELGSTVIVPFNSTDATGAPSSITGPTFQVRELQTKSIYNNANILPEMDMSGITGLHRVSIDTNNPFFRQGVDYILELTAGSVGATNVVGMICGSFSMMLRSDGLVLARTIKCHSGQVTAVGADPRREFFIDFEGVEETTDDFYKTQEFAFQSGGNGGSGRVCLSYDASTKMVTVQEPYGKNVEVGAKFVIIPHERELTIYTTHIEVEWGVGQGTGDRISVNLFADGQVPKNISTIVENAQVEAWDWGSDALVVQAPVTPAVNSGVFKHIGQPQDARNPNEGLTIRSTMEIEGYIYTFQRSIFNFA